MSFHRYVWSLWAQCLKYLFIAESKVPSFCQKCSLLHTDLVIGLARFCGTWMLICLFWFIIWLMDPWAPHLSFVLVCASLWYVSLALCFFWGVDSYFYHLFFHRPFSLAVHAWQVAFHLWPSLTQPAEALTRILPFHLPSFFSAGPICECCMRLWRAGWGWGLSCLGVRVGSMRNLLFSTRWPVGLLGCCLPAWGGSGRSTTCCGHCLAPWCLAERMASPGTE